MGDVKFISIIWLLPLVFMLHDFEEIILVVHIIQWIVFKKYIPAISTTVPA
ncbi:MAG: hypothetical protein ABF633_08475 [Clostridium sp.]|uniref:hypothetical protein n=1 Tax=Clostridium sp. TaxID=1506 RepID=UPI0039EAF5EF